MLLRGFCRDTFGRKSSINPMATKGLFCSTGRDYKSFSKPFLLPKVKWQNQAITLTMHRISDQGYASADEPHQNNLNETSTLIRTATGFPSLTPGLNRQLATAKSA